MPKRFSDTDKWKKVWFRELKPIHKCFWEYIRDNCNNAGIWDVDFKLASFQIGAKLNQGEIETVFEKQFAKVNDNKWFLTDFIEWQYNCSIDGLNPKNNAHLSAIRILDKFKIKELIEGLVRAQSAPKDKNKNKDKDMDMDKNKTVKHKYGKYKNVFLTYQELEKLKNKFPNWEHLINKLDSGIEMKGYKYKSHYLAIVNVWSKNDKQKKEIRGHLYQCPICQKEYKYHKEASHSHPYECKVCDPTEREDKSLRKPSLKYIQPIYKQE